MVAAGAPVARSVLTTLWGSGIPIRAVDLGVCLPDGVCVGQAGWSWCGRCSMP